MGEVVQLGPREVSDGWRFDPDEILEAAKGLDFANLAIIGELPDGRLYFAGVANANETLMLIERAKLKIISPD